MPSSPSRRRVAAGQETRNDLQGRGVGGPECRVRPARDGPDAEQERVMADEVSQLADEGVARVAAAADPAALHELELLLELGRKSPRLRIVFGIQRQHKLHIDIIVVLLVGSQQLRD